MELAVDNTGFVEKRDVLLESIKHDEEEVRGAIEELTAAARLQLSLRKYIEEFPLTCLVGSFMIGLWLGSRAAGAAETRRI